MTVTKDEKFFSHWKMLIACSLLSMCPFQYGLDFGLIGGLQAMPGFLEVSDCSDNHKSYERNQRLTCHRFSVTKIPQAQSATTSPQGVNN